MKTMIMCSMAALILSACALTPEQQRAREQAHLQFQQQLQVSLARQCDPATAELWQQSFQQPENQSAEAKKAFQLKYIEKSSDPIFKACYQMAWQNHATQQRLRQMRDWYEWQHDFYRAPFYRYPYWW